MVLWYKNLNKIFHVNIWVLDVWVMVPLHWEIHTEFYIEPSERSDAVNVELWMI